MSFLSSIKSHANGKNDSLAYCCSKRTPCFSPLTGQTVFSTLRSNNYFTLVLIQFFKYFAILLTLEGKTFLSSNNYHNKKPLKTISFNGLI